MHTILFEASRFLVTKSPNGLCLLERLPTNDGGALDLKRSVLDNSSEAVDLICRVLARERLGYHYQHELLIRCRGHWTAPADANQAWAALTSIFHFGAISMTWVPQESTSNPEIAGERVLPADAVPMGKICLKLANAVRGNYLALPELEGRTLHPVWGTPFKTWETPPLPDLSTVDPELPHLRQLFSAFNLPQTDWVALHLFLLGVFHAHSLDDPRPILFIDSWERGRGKSEITEAIAVLLDGTPTSIALDQQQQHLSDEITAHLVGGSRSLAGHNLDEAHKWRNTFLATLATDGNTGRRAKYGRQTTKFPGVVAVLNGIYGCFSLAEDLIVRLLRVQLGGHAQRLNPRPRHYAREHRQELIREILYCHSKAEPWPLEPLTRFNEFETNACAALVAGFGGAPERIQESLAASLRGAEALRDPCPASLYGAAAEKFHDPFLPVVAPGGVGKLEVPEGTRALGQIYTEGNWTQDQEYDD